VDTQREREARKEAAAREAYRRLRQAYAAARQEDSGRPPPAGPAGRGETLTPLQVVQVYEPQLQRSEEDLLAARAEARVLGEQLNAACAAASPAMSAEERAARVGEARSRAAARQVAAAEAAARRAEHRAQALQAELDARPKPEEHARLQRQADILARRLARVETAGAPPGRRPRGDAGGWAQARRPTSLGASPGASRMQTTAATGKTPALPKLVLAEVAREASQLLGCADPTALCAAIAALQDVAAAVPRLERFVADVCGVVFGGGGAHVPWGMRQDDPGDVAAILRGWVEQLADLQTQRATARALRRQLARAAGPQGRPPSGMTHPAAVEEDLVAQVARLVDDAEQARHTRRVFADAEAALAAPSPDALMHRLLLEFMSLFGGSARGGGAGLEFALPIMHQLKTEVTAARAFVAGLRTALGLRPAATLEACAKAVQALLRGAQEAVEGEIEEEDDPRGRATLVAVPPRQERERGGALQRAGLAAAGRAAARRGFPPVQIYVPAGRAAP
jgi:hypothetical protein